MGEEAWAASMEVREVEDKVVAATAMAVAADWVVADRVVAGTEERLPAAMVVEGEMVAAGATLVRAA